MRHAGGPLVLLGVAVVNLFVGMCSGETVMQTKAEVCVKYEEFGAVGDGQTDDLLAIVKAHAYANEKGLPVKANDDAIYYIGGKDATAEIQTDTDFGDATFVIDDRSIENIKSWVFRVSSNQKEIALTGIASLKKHQQNLGVTLPAKCLVTIDNSHLKQYIRKGNNQNNGSSQTDIILVDTDGRIDPQAPVIWNFERVTKITAVPLDTTVLTVRGGHFKTIANQAESKYNYHARGLAIRRSHVNVVGVEHLIEGEGNHGAPYSGFINIGNCANVAVREAVLSGHKTYQTIGSAGRPVSMGTYDISVGKSINVSFINCRQANDIEDRKLWGIMGSNYSKNLLYDGCRLSRFDAHKGVHNATIRNSTIGHAGINAIGHGLLNIENSTIHGRHLVNMRRDYGSTWDGEFVIRNSVFAPHDRGRSGVALISGRNDGQHDFGYTCYLPSRVTIENLKIVDDDVSPGYNGPAVFGEFNSRIGRDGYVEKYPMVRPETVILKAVTTVSGRPVRLSDNPVMFADVKLVRESE